MNSLSRKEIKVYYISFFCNMPEAKQGIPALSLYMHMACKEGHEGV